MTREFIHIQDFIVLIEEGSSSHQLEIDICQFEEPLIAVAFYGVGNVDLTARYGQKEKMYSLTKGLALSFYADETMAFEHRISSDKPLECIVIATTLRNIAHLPNQEGELFAELLEELIQPKDHYVEGPYFYMTPEMQNIINTIFTNPYQGRTRMMFFRSQVTALLSHFFGQLALISINKSKHNHYAKLNLAKEILLENIDNPPSLTALSKQIGLNVTKLKKEFKELFGAPVFKYLQNERLTLAHKLISENKTTIQEAAWQVGYDSLGSFSNAFMKKFGYRPSQIK